MYANMPQICICVQLGASSIGFGFQLFNLIFGGRIQLTVCNKRACIIFFLRFRDLGTGP